MTTKRIEIVQDILNVNDQIAEETNALLHSKHIFSLNIMASPGAGKTSLILKTLQALPPDMRAAVLEGDTAPVTIDAEKVHGIGVPAIQINTGGDCHLNANLVKKGIQALDLDNLDFIIVENVGNLICPAAWKLGTDMNMVIASIPEGDDKPYKYPNIYRGIQALVLNKIDLKPYVDFNVPYFKEGITALNPNVEFFEVSSKTGEGIPAWAEWLRKKIESVA
ncbi:MAG TPA: hydrogenase accessory protein HypB [Anaerolineaceae bacterium]|uniref:Hydrogenase nickel incorporation protein HypB n=1 Tax=Anaerolinea thermophila TaxID=167964 RepID=A0A101FZ42_9CHLR|nr:MAG: Hydrogenase nickel incorporation protein HypB [Anaerolinea thermophila]HAF60819.1 hydrogenase accessory protein HypB [Anaerolineaceae bacterium]